MFRSLTAAGHSQGRDGKLEVAGESAPGKFGILQTLTTLVDARTLDVDLETHKAYLATAEFEEQTRSDKGVRPPS